MREIVLDTETTGFDHAKDDRVVEIGCIELINHVPSGETFQRYLNPERDMPPGAFAVHGLSAEFLADKPLFADVVDDFLAFIGRDALIIHNASFDLDFLDAELLAEVYLALIGGRQPSLGLGASETEARPVAAGDKGSAARPPRPHEPSPAEIKAHTASIDELKDPIWRRK